MFFRYLLGICSCNISRRFYMTKHDIATPGDRLAYLMARDNISLEQIAEICGLNSPRSVRKWLKNEGDIKERYIELLSELFHVSPSWLRYGVSLTANDTDNVIQKAKMRLSGKSPRTERMLRSTLQLAKIVAWELDIETEELKWQGEAESVFGFGFEDMGNTFHALVSLLKPDDQKSFTDAFGSVVEYGETETLAVSIDLGGGTFMPLYCALGPVTNSRDEMIGVLGYFQGNL